MKNQLVHIKLLAKRLALLWIVFIGIKIWFVLHNQAIFSELSFASLPSLVAGSLRFDLVTIIYLNSLFILLHIIPVPWRDKRRYQQAMKMLFLVVNIPAIIIELSDVVYYSFNNKRMTSDIAGVTGAGIRNIPSFLIDFWYIFLGLALIIYILIRFYQRLLPSGVPVKYNYLTQSVLFVLVAGICIGGARGGIQTIPVTPANAADHADVRYAPIVLNSTYSVLYSLQRPALEELSFMKDPEAVLHSCKSYTAASSTHPNIVFIILESCATEYIGYLNNGKGQTPFLDSLFSKSIVYKNCFANAERSNKSMCVLLGGLPSLTDDAFMNTIYSANCFEGLGTLLKRSGYYTSFFHGGLNGEFKFDSFTKAAGFDHYYGNNEFNDDRYFDGNWGIYDDAFFSYTADQLAGQPEPFCSALFSLSSHHPFNVPPALKPLIPDGDKVIHESITYTDYSVKKFFDKASKMPWFRNTLFVITADHTFGYGEHPAFYNNAPGRYRVPLAFFKGDGSVKTEIRADVAQHLDIVPTLLDFANYSGRAKTYGRNLNRNDASTTAVQLVNNTYQAIDDQYILFFDGLKTAGLFDYISDPGQQHDLSAVNIKEKSKLELQVKALLQDYHHALINNSLCKNCK